MPILDWCLIVVDRRVDPRAIRADDLRYLLAVARSRNRRSAASDLGVDTSTVTQADPRFGNARWVPSWCGRTPPGGITEAGRTVAETAGPIEDAVERVAGAVAGDQGRTLRGNVRVTAPDAFGAYFVAPALAGLHRRHPDLTVELLTATREPNLHQSGFDSAITVGTPTSGQVVSETAQRLPRAVCDRRLLAGGGCADDRRRPAPAHAGLVRRFATARR